MLIKYVFLLISLAIVSCKSTANNSNKLQAFGTKICPSQIPQQNIAALIIPGVGNGLQPFCSGVFIAKDIVLTNAHCLVEIPKNSLILVANGSNIKTNNLYKVIDKAVHPKYISSTFNPLQGIKILTGSKVNDIAVIYVRKASSNTNTAPSNFSQVAPNPITVDGKVDTITFGWAPEYKKDLFKFGCATGTLGRTFSKVFTKNKLKAIGNYLGKFFIKYNKNNYSCYGDSGGPIFKRIDANKYELLALTSLATTKNFLLCRSGGTSKSIVIIDDYSNWIKEVSSKLRVTSKIIN